MSALHIDDTYLTDAGYTRRRKWYDGANDPERKKDNPFEKSLVTIVSPRYPYQWFNDLTQQWVDDSAIAYTELPGPPVFDIAWDPLGPVIPPLFEQELQSRLRMKIAGHNFAGGVAVGELRETAKGIAGSANELSSLFKKRVIDRLSRKARALGRLGAFVTEAQRRWLEASYAWLPLIGSLDDGARAFAHLRYGQKPQKVFKSYKMGDNVRPTSVVQYDGKGVLRKSYTAHIQEELSLTSSLGLADWKSIVWELMPYSFVYDWFHPVGAYLQNAEFFGKLNATFDTTVKHTQVVRGGNLVHPTLHGQVAYYQELVYFKRAQNVQFVVNVPPPNPPKDWFGLRRVVSALALMNQRFRLLS